MFPKFVIDIAIRNHLISILEGTTPETEIDWAVTFIEHVLSKMKK